MTLALIMSLFVCVCSGGALSSDSNPSEDKKTKMKRFWEKRCTLVFADELYRWTDRDSYTVDSNVVNEYSAGVQNKAAQSVQLQKYYLDSNGMQYKSLQLMKSEGTIDRSRGLLTDGTNSIYAETTTYVGMSDVHFEAMDLMLGNKVYSIIPNGIGLCFVIG